MEKCVPIIILMYNDILNRNKYTHTRYNDILSFKIIKTLFNR